MIAHFVLAGAALAASAALVPTTGSAQTAGGDTWQFRCPAAGTVVEQSTGAELKYRGEAANNPGSCMLQNGQRRLLGYWQVSEGFYRAGGKEIAARVAGPGVNAAGTQPVTFDYFTNNRTNESIHVQESWRVAGSGPLTVPAGTFNTVRVERQFRILGSAFAYTQTVWFDRATGAPVSARVEHLNAVQAPTLVNWVANDVIVPAAARTAAAR